MNTLLRIQVRVLHDLCSGMLLRQVCSYKRNIATVLAEQQPKMKTQVFALFFSLLFQFAVSQQCDVVVTSHASLKKELQMLLGSYNVNSHSNTTCASITNAVVDELETRLEEKLDAMLDTKLEAMLESIQQDYTEHHISHSILWNNT